MDVNESQPDLHAANLVDFSIFEERNNAMLHTLLKQKNPYYSRLSPEGQKKFEQRLYDFIESKNFAGRDNLLTTDEMRVLISAAAVQLTFGLSDFLIINLQTINIFPGEFYSKLYKTGFKGLTTQHGVLSLSWKDFVYGYKSEKDKLNLGLHEMAHALNINLDEGKNSDARFAVDFEKWKRASATDFYSLKEGRTKFLRKYGAVNMAEFFAVCVEHFFEMPDEFKKQLPGLYRNMTILLNQDPSNVAGDYKLKETSGIKPAYLKSDDQRSLQLIRIPEKAGSDQKQKSTVEDDNTSRFHRFLKTYGIYIAMITTVCGLIGIPILFWFASVIVIDNGVLLFMLFGCGLLGLIQWKYVKDHLDMAYHQFAMFSFVGFGMCMLNLLLLLNYSIRIGNRTETYKISRQGYYNQITIEGDKNYSALDRNINKYCDDDTTESILTNQVTITFTKGILGFDIIKKCTFN